jgi:hypothetical protein
MSFNLFFFYSQMVLQPHVRYQLSDGAQLHLADVSAVYQRLSVNLEADDGSGSETGSESMLTVNNTVVEGESSKFSDLGNDIVIFKKRMCLCQLCRLNCLFCCLFQHGPEIQIYSFLGLTVY